LLIGEFEHSIDTKGRLVLPAKIKDDLGKEFIVTKGLDGCLFGYSLTEWNKFEEKLKTLPLTNKITRDFVRFFLSGAVEEETDKQGRFLLPANLREYASLTKDAVIIGVGTRIEIWDKKKWDEYNSEENLSVDSIAEKMTELGILGI
jgi:MraZ protein